MNASSVVARVLSKYVDCRHRQGPVCEQKMADLLVDSLTDHPLSALIFNPLVWVKLQRRLGKLYLHVPKEGFLVATQVEQVQYLTDNFLKTTIQRISAPAS